MFDLDAGKLLIVGAVALVFIPPKDLPRVLRQAGQFVGKMKRMASEFQGQFMDAMREADMAELRREAQKLSESTRVDLGLDGLHDINRQVTRAIDHQPGVSQTNGMASDAVVPTINGRVGFATDAAVSPAAEAPGNALVLPHASEPAPGEPGHHVSDRPAAPIVHSA